MQYSFSYFLLAIIFGMISWFPYERKYYYLSGVFIWFAFSFLMLAFCYLVNSPSLLGKTRKGGRWFWAWPFFMLYFLLSWLALTIWRLGDRRSPYVEVAPKLLLGRHLTEAEADKAIQTYGIRAVVDLAVEISESEPFRELKYYSIPALDAMPPTVEQLREALNIIEREQKHGTLYLHCAYGHGRSCTVAVAHLLKTGLAMDFVNAVAQVKAIRKGVKISPAQRKVILEVTGRDR